MATNQPAGIGARVAAGLSLAVTGRVPAWFGPGPAPDPIAKPAPVARQFDYPVGFNLRITPRQDEAISFEQLRALADRWDLLRLVIETRKDQIATQSWAIRSRVSLADDPRIARLTALLLRPDREHGWAEWLRMLLEDMFVLDAPVLHPRFARNGDLVGLDLIDGATIKRILSDDGRTPEPPDAAYQQVLKGVPAVDYTTDELIYQPRNPRAHRVYGLSPVEQIVTTVNIALRRQFGQLSYFTAGNTPDALVGVPDDWTADQIKSFQDYWDALLEGNIAARRTTRFVPGGLKYQPTREPPLKDDFDEWLARVVCFAFSIPPTPFVRAVNRATAETAQQAALSEGLAPLLAWVKGLMDRVIGDYAGCPNLEFVWTDSPPIDPAVRAQIDVAYVTAGIKTPDEVRASLGLGPLPPGYRPPQIGMAKAGYNPAENRNQIGEWATDASDQGVQFTPVNATPATDASVVGDGAVVGPNPEDVTYNLPYLDWQTAWNHYRTGDGSPLQMNFSQLHTDWVKPELFPKVQAAIASGPGSYQIDDKLGYYEQQQNEFRLIGGATLHLTGELKVDEDTWNFEGRLAIFDKGYNFHWSPSRPFDGQLAVFYGSLFEGKEFQIHIRGSRHISGSGKILSQDDDVLPLFP